MTDEYRPTKRSWPKKLQAAFRALWVGMRGQSSFAVHFLIAGLVVVLAAILKVRFVEWCILALCITIVLSAEMFNSALEHLARAIDSQENPHLATGLDIASAAVLVAAIGAAVVGAAIFLFRLGIWLGWWAIV